MKKSLKLKKLNTEYTVKEIQRIFDVMQDALFTSWAYQEQLERELLKEKMKNDNN